jgi:hypothetical protein
MSRTTLRVLAAATIGVAFVGNASLIDVPKSLGPIDDSQTPAAIVSSGRTGQAVVWLGRVESATVKKEGGRVVLEWVCRHLLFAEPSKRAIERSPIRFTPGKSGYFVVNLVANMPAETAESVSTDLIHAGKYILVAGRAAAIVRRGGKDAVFLHTEQMLQSDEIAEPAKQPKSQEQRAIRAAERVSVNVLDAGLPDKPFASGGRQYLRRSIRRRRVGPAGTLLDDGRSRWRRPQRHQAFRVTRSTPGLTRYCFGPTTGPSPTTK